MTTLIYEKLPAIMKQIGAIGKDKYNSQQKFKFRGIDDVMNTLHPILTENQVFVVPEVITHEREERKAKAGGNLIYSVCTIKYTFYASDGSCVSAVVVGEGMDSGDKATNKAMAIAFKYACFQVFCIPTEEMKDPDADTPPESQPKSKEPPKTDKPDVEFTDNSEKLICEECKRKINGIKTAKHSLSAKQVAEKSKKKYGRALCEACSKKEKDKLNADK